MNVVPMKRTTVGFSEPFYERLQEVAAEHGISVSQLIREGVLFYIAYEQGLADRGAKAALSGRRGAPDMPSEPPQG